MEDKFVGVVKLSIKIFARVEAFLIFFWKNVGLRLKRLTKKGKENLAQRVHAEIYNFLMSYER